MPQNILDTLGLTGKLSGANKNRVKAIKLRGVVSQGLIAPLHLVRKESDAIIEGMDVAQEMGIVKYEPPVPPELRGSVSPLYEFAFKFDVENYKKYPDIFEEGERVFITEKLHGTFSLFMLVVDEELRQKHEADLIEGKYLVGSKGQSAAGLFFKPDTNNVYTRNLTTPVKNALDSLAKNYTNDSTKCVFIIGETLGVQKGFDYGSVLFRAFGAGVTLKTSQKGYLDFKPFQQMMVDNGVVTVPVLYEGRFSKEKMIELSNGKETVSGEDKHMREGVVLYSYNEGYHPDIGRRILKYVGDDYLMKSTGEEFN